MCAPNSHFFLLTKVPTSIHEVSSLRPSPPDIVYRGQLRRCGPTTGHVGSNHSELLSCYQEPTLDIWRLWRSQIAVTFNSRFVINSTRIGHFIYHHFHSRFVINSTRIGHFIADLLLILPEQVTFIADLLLILPEQVTSQQICY